jgi:hypothetical protein
VIETGADAGRVTAGDVELARKLLKRGTTSRARTARGK